VKLSRAGLVINGDPFYSPKIGISPFSLSSPKNPQSIDAKGIDKLNQIFQSSAWTFTESGKSAIDLALNSLSLERDDEVWIQTSSGNSYVSRCVTQKISNYCNWSMEKSAKTKVIYFIHDFGRDGSQQIEHLRVTGMPIIEDAAYGLITAKEGKWDFSRSEFLLFSFPKVFEMQFGGILCGTGVRKTQSGELVNFVARGASKWILSSEDIFTRRRHIYSLLKLEFEKLGFTASYALAEHENPGVFMFETDREMQLDDLKIFFNEHGCESSVFYGRSSYFVPVHQQLDENLIKYFADVLLAFISGSQND
jgi:hypothetical protein